MLKLAEYINTLDDFVVYGDIRASGKPAYNHMGALLADAILQAGLNYENVVYPRVLRVLENYPEAVSTSGLLSVLEANGYLEVLKWNDQEKPSRLKMLATFLKEQKVETVMGLRGWLNRPGARNKLLELHGIGPKTADYLCVLTGLPSVAVDRHLKRFCEYAGVKDSLKEAIRQAAIELETDEGSLDYSIWAYMSQKRD